MVCNNLIKCRVCMVEVPCLLGCFHGGINIDVFETLCS
jgi:hypothetical protein